jgi:murein DD-endopeptidase MepM/ murein hydrolase activator NlpD
LLIYQSENSNPETTEERSVSPATKYKRAEKEAVSWLSKEFRKILGAVASFFKLAVQKGRQRFTVMFIPHSEKKIFNFHISIFSLIFLAALVVVLVIAFFALSTHFTASGTQISRLEKSLAEAENNLEQMRDEVSELSRVAADFEFKMRNLLSVVDTGEETPFSYTGEGGDLSAFLGTGEEEGSTLMELADLRELRRLLANLLKPVGDISGILAEQRDLLVDIPTLWPIKDGWGYITAFFGPEENPFTKGFRLHTGVDIASSRNTPIVATANGKVQSVTFEPNGLGNAITLSHKYGFFTRYGHLNKVVVRKGAKISRGQIIGYMGSTGNSTGNHLHYEVLMGSQHMDPMDYIDIDSPLVQKTSYGR